MQEIRLGNLNLRGTSIAGVCTSLHIPQLKVVLDAGILHPAFAKEAAIFLSHCHMDHIGSLPALLGVRQLKGLSPTAVFVPSAVAPDVSSLISAAVGLGKFKDTPSVVGLNHGDSYPTFSVFKTYHTVPSNGYTFWSTKKKLKDEYKGLPGVEIVALRKKGVEVTDSVRNAELSYCTDTRIDVVNNPDVVESDVLILECTFIDDTVPVESARWHGHVHIDEIVANADKFKNKHILLMHFSTRYSNDAIRKAVDTKLPTHLRERVQLLLPNEEQ